MKLTGSLYYFVESLAFSITLSTICFQAEQSRTALES